MNRIKIALAMVSVLFFVSACEDPDAAPIVTFDSAGHGGYPRLISESGSRNIDLFNVSGSSYGYSIEFVDESKGDDVAEYILNLEYIDATGENTVSPAVEYLRVPASSFTVSAEGFKSIADVTLPATALLSAIGLSEADLDAADVFHMTGTVVMKNGDVFTGVNSSASVEGSAFRGHFDFSMPAICPSNLGGTHDYSTVGWCGGTITGTTTWVDNGDGHYSVADFSFGAYTECYNTSTTPDGNLEIYDFCNKLSPLGADQWGDSYIYNSVVVAGNQLTIDWINTYGEAGVTTFTREGGADWPAELY